MISYLFGWTTKPELTKQLGRQKPILPNYEVIRLVQDDILTDILAVKLKPTPVVERQTHWEHRHPVLRELLLKTKRL
jgi:hypothetical protein